MQWLMNILRPKPKAPQTNQSGIVILDHEDQTHNELQLVDERVRPRPIQPQEAGNCFIWVRVVLGLCSYAAM